ncbi:hypothetical protein KCU88_g6689, partial [Aureobasidium melanogenum]
MSSDSQPKSKGKDAASIIAAASRPSKPAPQHTSFKNDDKKTVWCETQWTNLSIQAKKLDMPTLPYFDPETMLLSKEVNRKLWNQLSKLWNYLGPDRAPYATPILHPGGEVKWHSFLDGDLGSEAEIYDDAVDAFMSDAPRPGWVKLCLITLGRTTLGDMLGYTLCPVLNIRPDKPVALKYVPPTVGGFNLSFHAESHVDWIAGRDP